MISTLRAVGDEMVISEERLVRRWSVRREAVSEEIVLSDQPVKVYYYVEI